MSLPCFPCFFPHCLCSPQLLLFALWCLEVFCPRPELAWICAALAWASPGISIGCSPGEVCAGPDRPSLDLVMSVSPPITSQQRGALQQGTTALKLHFTLEGSVEVTAWVGFLDFFTFFEIKGAPSWCGSSGSLSPWNILLITPLTCFYYYFHMILQSLHTGSHFLVTASVFS